MRDFLLYLACSKGACETELFGSDRIYDVAINDYTEIGINPKEAEYQYSVDVPKYRHVKKDLSNMVFNYKACAFFDDDLRVKTADLNKLFTAGAALELNLWQAALTKDSYASWQHLYQKQASYVRKTNFVEIMMPFFSRSALEICWESFGLNYSAWGLDFAWSHLLKNEGLAVIDCFPVTHIRPIKPHNETLPNGLTPRQEADLVFKHYGLNPPTMF